MMNLPKSPALTDGVEAWRSWLTTMEKLAVLDEDAPFLEAARQRGMTVINLLEKYPDGIDVRQSTGMHAILAFAKLP